jgi:hypothetical protein
MPKPVRGPPRGPSSWRKGGGAICHRGGEGGGCMGGKEPTAARKPTRKKSSKGR